MCVHCRLSLFTNLIQGGLFVRNVGEGYLQIRGNTSFLLFVYIVIDFPLKLLFGKVARASLVRAFESDSSSTIQFDISEEACTLVQSVSSSPFCRKNELTT